MRIQNLHCRLHGSEEFIEEPKPESVLDQAYEAVMRARSVAIDGRDLRE